MSSRLGIVVGCALLLVVFLCVCQFVQPSFRIGRVTYRLMPLKLWRTGSIIWDGGDPATGRMRSGIATFYGPVEHNKITWEEPPRPITPPRRARR